MGLFSYTIAGSGFILIGSNESLTSSKKQQSLLISVGISFFSFLFILNSLISLFNSVSLNDHIGYPLQLQVLAIAFLFLFYSILCFISRFSRKVVTLPASLLELILLLGFVEEFLLYYLQRKDTSGIENRYFDLLLVPIAICVVSTLFKLLKDRNDGDDYARIARGVGLVLQGTWFMQMGISFYTNLIVHGCYLHEKSRGDFTIKCKGHPEYHRARGIATLQFNCHLALLVVMVVTAYSVLANKKGGDRGDFSRYKPLGAEIQMSNGQFTLDSDEDEIHEEENGINEKAIRVDMGVNGHSSHH